MATTGSEAAEKAASLDTAELVRRFTVKREEREVDRYLMGETKLP